MSKSKKSMILNDDPVVVEVRPLCSRADMIGTPRPDGGTITSVTEADDFYVATAAVMVTALLDEHLDPTGKVAQCAARWANIALAVDLRCLGEVGAAGKQALSALQPPEVDSA